LTRRKRRSTAVSRSSSDTFNMGEGDGGGRQSKTAAELNQPGARGEGMATGGMGRPFKADPNTGEFENVQRERVKQAEAETEKRFEARRAEAERLKAEFEARRTALARATRAAAISSSAASRTSTPTPAFPHDRRRLCGRRGGNPVVWPTQGAAAKWAARFKMGGDFELQAHGTSKRGGEQPVTLQRKPGSDLWPSARARRRALRRKARPQLEHSSAATTTRAGGHGQPT
jgi:hypothetical protein